MANLSKYWFYHGTTEMRAHSIKRWGFKKDTKVGSLGFGSYAFANSPKDALVFAKNKIKAIKNKSNYSYPIRPKILEFKLKKKYCKYILDFTIPKNIKLFNLYTQAIDKYTHIKELSNAHTNEGKVNILDGYIINYYLKRILKKSGFKYLGVYNLSQNDLGGAIIKYSLLPNSMELNIRCNDIIDFSTLNYYNNNEN